MNNRAERDCYVPGRNNVWRLHGSGQRQEGSIPQPVRPMPETSTTERAVEEVMAPLAPVESPKPSISGTIVLPKSRYGR